MADPQKPGQTPGGETEKPAIPSFSAVAAESRDARANELADLSGVKPGNAATTDANEIAAPATVTDAFDFDAEWNKLPEPLRNGVVERVYTQYNAALQSEYGDVLPLITEARTNPNLRAALAAAASDAELREALADPDARKIIGQLSKKELREFLGGPAIEAYEKYATPAQPSADRPDPRDQRIAALESRFESETNERDTQGYIGARQREMLAVKNEFGNMSDDQLGHVVRLAEQQFENAALRAGVKVGDDNPGWAGQALRAGVRPPSYKSVAEQYAEVLGRSAPPAAPATTAATPPAPPQAPRTTTEGKKRGLELIKKAGGFQGLAAASARRTR